MKLHDRLILNKYFLSLFDVSRFADLRLESEKEPNLRDILFNVEEDFKGLDNTNYLNSILFSKLDLDKDLKAKIENYDKNIRGYLNYINQKRDDPIILTYFQYLSILFTEVFLDRYYNNRKGFIIELNKFVRNENKNIDDNKNKYSYFHERDLNKLAFYMATGERVIIVTGCSLCYKIKGFRNFKQI